MDMIVTYYHHSGFSVQADDVLLVFDYWRGENGTGIDGRCALGPERLADFKKVYVFISHEHPDHFDPVVYEWRDAADITYIVADDMPVGTRGRRMGPGSVLTLDDRVRVRAFDSTDLGVSWLVDIGGATVFHAGDLNFWHWQNEQTAQEIEESERLFHEAVEALRGEKINVAMFPVDPRQGQAYDAGANYFLMTVKPELLIPMHFWGRGDLMNEFARKSRSRETEILPMVSSGDRAEIAIDGGQITAITYVPMEKPPRAEFRNPAEALEEIAEGEDPFEDTDLPVSLDDE